MEEDISDVSHEQSRPDVDWVGVYRSMVELGIPRADVQKALKERVLDQVNPPIETQELRNLIVDNDDISLKDQWNMERYREASDRKFYAMVQRWRVQNSIVPKPDLPSKPSEQPAPGLGEEAQREMEKMGGQRPIFEYPDGDNKVEVYALTGGIWAQVVDPEGNIKSFRFRPNSSK